jgi:hypothetical protein
VSRGFAGRAWQPDDEQGAAAGLAFEMAALDVVLRAVEGDPFLLSLDSEIGALGDRAFAQPAVAGLLL